MTSGQIATVPATTPNLLIQAGDRAPAEVGGRYSRIVCASVDDRGEVAISADLADSDVPSALFLSSQGQLKPLLRAGDAAPAGGRYARFCDLDLSSIRLPAGSEFLLTFRAMLAESPAPEGLFLWTPDGVQTLALAGAKSPRGRDFCSFARPTLVAFNMRPGLGFVLAYEAIVDSNLVSVVMHPSYGEPLETLAVGDRLGEEEVVDLSISRMGGVNVAGLVRLQTECGETANEIAFVKHGLTIHGCGLREGARFPALGPVQRIAGPPAVALQVAFASVELSEGRSALVSSDIVGNAQVFARSGDVIPDLPGDPIASFAPPVANAAFPLDGPTGLVAPVRMRSGRRALWSAVFSGMRPLQGVQRLLPTTEEMVPIKLTNRGTLLLRSQPGEGEDRRERWMTIEGLFDPDVGIGGTA